MLDSRNFNDLVEPFRQKAMRLIVVCQDHGLKMLVTSTLRDLECQAALYRVNRTRTEIAAKVEKMRARGWPELARIIEQVGPQKDRISADGKKRPVTNAGPGESWHNYGVAMDAYPLQHGKLILDEHAEEWEIYGRVAKELGLNWAGSWTSFRELPHVQAGAGSNPLRVLPRDEVLSHLKNWL